MAVVGNHPAGARPGLDFRALGPLTVLDGEVPLVLGGVKRKAVLAVLLSAANRVVSATAIVDSVWEDDPPPSVTSAVQVAVSALRTQLGPGVIETAPPGYRLVVGDGQSDVQRFRDLARSHVQARARGDLTAAADLGRQAVAEWSGAAYQDLAGLRFADELAARLDEERLATLVSRVEVDLMLGRHADLVPELSELCAQHTLVEPLWGQYMLALYRCGRQADALAACRQLKERLADELGLDPSGELRTLEAAVLNQDPRLEWRPAAAPDLLATARDLHTLLAWVAVNGAGPVAVPASGLHIGRDPVNDVPLDDPRVSRRHASVVPRGAGFVVVDLHSTNGTRVNGELIVGEHALADGDTISVGEATLLFSCGRSGA